MMDKNFNYKLINSTLFADESCGFDNGINLAESIKSDIKRIRNVETSNSLTVQYGRVEQIRACAEALLKQCAEAEDILNKETNRIRIQKLHNGKRK